MPTTFTIHWVAETPHNGKLSETFDATNWRECKRAETLLQCFHTQSTPYKITGDVFSGLHSVRCAEVA